MLGESPARKGPQRSWEPQLRRFGEAAPRLPESKIIFISTPDDEILNTATCIAELAEDSARGRTVLHTSGALSVFRGPGAVGGEGLSHWLGSSACFGERATSGADKLVGAFSCIEGDAAASRVARSIVKKLKGNSFHLPSNNKPLYHAAAVMASGHMVALFSLATEC